MRLFRLTLLLLAICALAICQASLDNATILKLVKAGIGEDTIVGMVNQQQGRYALSADDIIALKNAGVSDKILSAMIVRNGAGAAPSTPPVAASSTPSNPPAPPSPLATQPPHPNDGITRVYISDSQSWEMRGGWAAGGHTNANGSGSWSGGGYQAGGARPQTAEIMKTFNQRCPSVTITNNVAKADFAVILDHEGGKGLARRRNKIVVFNRDGDDIFSDSTRELGSSVKDACQAILNHAVSQQSSAAVDTPSTGAVANSYGPPPVVQLPFAFSAKTPATSHPAAAPLVASKPQPISQATAPMPPQPEQPPQPEAKIEVTITSDPSGAAVEINGVAVGSTPVTAALAPGTACTLTLKKDGFVPWVVAHYPTAAAGKFNLNANLTREVFR
jgi:hypothetical protein